MDSDRPTGVVLAMDVTRSLARQSLVVAVVAAMVDTAQLVLCGAFGTSPALAWPLAIAVVTVDLALAAAPSTRAVVAVAVAQAVLKVGIAVFAHHHGLPARVPDVGFLVAGYRAGAWLGGFASVGTVTLLAAGAAVANLLVGGILSRDWRLFPLAVAGGVVPWLVGRYTTARGAYIAELEQRERLRQQEQLAALDRALVDEREAIARDLHDVITHHVSAIGIHAGAARIAVSHSDSAATVRSLTAVETSSRAAMVDLRRQLDLLHGRDDGGQRQPGLVDIDDLVQRVGEAGLTVRVDISGEPPVLPESLDVMLYRVVQEILTNALRHGRDPARLEIRYGPTRVQVRESNPVGHVVSSENPHRGLDGIRRRVELFGGTVQSGKIGERWEILVSVPIGAA
ncbi:sensor histidine kinase [Nocardia jejuensis]|uniref:sensor histidine kinase n=1 Tax=Nocardia jejuensis TaxID=328049 RepID=UPI001FDEC4A7|nr:histidine kinase [Nocardia jejuensis]